MQNHEDFTVFTSQALDYASAFHKVSFTDAQKSDLLGIYRVLPAFSDVREGLVRLQTAGFRLYAFSNGKTDALVSGGGNYYGTLNAIGHACKKRVQP